MARETQKTENGGLICDSFIDEPIIMFSTGKLEYTQEAEIFIGEIHDEEMDELLIADIEAQGDRQNHASNVKAQMTQWYRGCLLYTSPSPRDVEESRMPSSA